MRNHFSKFRDFTATIAIALALTFGCASDIEMPPQPDNSSSSAGETGQSSSGNSSSSGLSSSSSSWQSSSSSAMSSSSLLSSSDTQNTDSSSSSSLEPSSSAGQSSSSSNSSSSLGGSSSSALAPGSSSESQELGTLDGTYFTDPRDGKKYEYETRNGQIWMSENLNYSRGNTLGWCYASGETTLGTAGANSSGCNSPFGRTYTWSIATDENSPRGLCPKGWHIPSRAEWQAIGVGTTSEATGSRPMSDGFYVKAGNFNKNASYTLGWNNRGNDGYWWTSDPNRYFIFLGNGRINTQSSATEDDYFSVRCVADNGVFSVSSSSATPSSSSTTSSSSSTTPSSVGCLPNSIEKTCTTSNMSNLGTGAVCIKQSGKIGGWTASNAQDRTCTVNGGSSISPDVSGNINVGGSASSTSDGYAYINCTGGTNPSFAMNCW